MWWQQALARAGVRTAYGRDVVLAALLSLIGFTRVLFAFMTRGGQPVTLDSLVLANAAATVDLGLLAFRRRTPRTALLASVAVALGSAMLPAIYRGTGIAVVVCTYTVATLLSPRATSWIVSGCAAAHLIGGVVISRAGGHVEDVLTFFGNDGSSIRNLVVATVVGFGVPALFGSYIQTRRAYTAELAEKVDRMELERSAQAEAAIAEERGRIARELHDIAAHDLSAIIVQAGAADRLIERDPEAVRSTLQAIRTQGRDTLTALRGLVGIMRASDDPAAVRSAATSSKGRADRSPQPSMGRLDDLVDRSRQLGMNVELLRSGEYRPLPLVVDLAAYRVIQESLTNARQHADGAAVRVEVVRRDRELLLSVHNDAPAIGHCPVPNSGGHGLIGMTERVGLANGVLRDGPTADGGWLVEARFPLAEPDQP